MNPLLHFRNLVLLMLSLTCLGCNGQSARQTFINQEKVDQTPPERYGIPNTINSIDTSAGWTLKGQKILLTGIVYQLDGKTPAPNVVVYYYQTNVEGKYLHKETEERSLPPNSEGQTHGYIRGWVKTDQDGKYFIYTIKPGTYPSRDEPAHVHLTLTDPKMKKSYYIDDVVFDDDVLLTTAKRIKMENRGGGGVVRLVKKGDLHIGERNIILGLNVPNYPIKREQSITSGKDIGEDVISFTPFHAWGPDKGTKTCPVCKYGWYNGVLYFVGNHPNWEEIKQWLTFLESESTKRTKYLKVYFVYGNTKNYDKKLREKELEQLGIELKLKNVALTFVPSFTDKASEVNLNRINEKVESTFIIYRRRRVVNNFINLKPTLSNFKSISLALDQSANEYFNLPSIHDEL